MFEPEFERQKEVLEALDCVQTTVDWIAAEINKIRLEVAAHPDQKEKLKPRLLDLMGRLQSEKNTLEKIQ